MMRTPAFFASSGMISGTGFAIAKMMGSGAIVLTISAVRLPGAETPMNTSAPLMTSCKEPAFFSRLEIFAISALISLSPSLPS